MPTSRNPGVSTTNPAASLGDDEKSVEHPRVRLGAGGGEDDDHLIDIGGDDALAVRAAGGSTRQTRAPRQYVADGPPVAARIRLDDHFIADRELQSILATRPGARRVTP